jgi:hypothetical protein
MKMRGDIVEILHVKIYTVSKSEIVIHGKAGNVNDFNNHLLCSL